MSLVGLNCLLVSSDGGTISLASIRASTQPLQRSSDLSQAKVLIEYLEGLKTGQREWLTLTDYSSVSAVYIEDQLVWARRVLPTETDSNNPVAWPAKAYSLLCGGLGVSRTTVLVEYFCDQERSYLQLSDTKQLNLIEAKGTLSQHTQMLNELTDWEGKQHNRDALLFGSGNLSGQRVRICSVQQHLSWITGTVMSHNLQTRELTVEDVHHMVHTVNPYLVEVILMSIPPPAPPQVQQVSTTGTAWYPDNLLLPNSSQTPLQHPGGYYGNNHAPRGPVTHNLSLMQSEPALHVPQHFDTPPPHHLGGSVSHHPYTPSGSYSNIAMNSPLGPPSQPPTHFSNYLDPLYRHERSKSLGNLRLLSQTQRDLANRRRSHAVPLTGGRGPKRTRFAENTLLPPIPQQEEPCDFPPNRTLSRSISQPSLFLKPQSSVKQDSSVNETEEDDLDLIQSIISRETSITDSPPPSNNLQSQLIRSHSLSHIPHELGSLPSLHHASSLHVLHENYTSTPDVTMGLGSPPPYVHNAIGPPNKLPVGHHPDYQDHKPNIFDGLSEDGLLSALNIPYVNEGVESQHPPVPVHVASSPRIVSPCSETEESLKLDQGSEINIDCIVNQHMGEEDEASKPQLTFSSSLTDIHSEVNRRGSGEKTRISNREVVIHMGSQGKRGRGRPRLTDDEKQRRKELREMGLIKRSKRRTKEEVLQWKADKVRTPAKRGRKPGTGKKNMIKGVTGKIILVTVDLSRYENGSIFFQNGFCQAYHGISRCIECSNVSGDYPSSRYCRFLEFRKLRVINKDEGSLYVEGFATFSDAKAEDLVPWTPLKTGYSGLNTHTGLYVLSRIVKNFIAIIAEEARTISDTDTFPIWKCAVKGVRELCDTCDTTIFNLHWVCQHCGFSICPACFQVACISHNGSEAMSSWQTPWPLCTVNQVSHTPYQLLLSQIIPGNVLSDVLCQLFQICRSNSISIATPPPVSRLLSLLSKLTVSTQEQPRKPFSVDAIKTIGEPSSSSSPAASSSLDRPSVLEPILELPHSCSNDTDDFSLPPKIDAPHLWLCDGDILYLLDATHLSNITAFQWAWHRSRPVVVAGIDKYLNKEIWTPNSFLQDFGEEPADLVDCRTGLIMPQVPSKAFWGGFDDIHCRLQDPVSNCPRLLKLKDWPTGEDFSDKLPQRFHDLVQALPLPDYTRRDGKLNLTSSLPDFFVKPDLGPKMYNAYGTSTLAGCGTTNLHLDVSDAVNVMVYCTDTDKPNEKDELYETVERETCQATVGFLKQSKEIGALWHIYPPSDSDKIRQFLRKVMERRGMSSSKPGSDPIHDQLIYMDAEIRQKLWEEEGVKGWTIAQCKGDAIFIPAGAPHQVQNHCSCIKIAEDFVSPEHVNQCVLLTEEFRQLSSYHSNHEDKLQIKNILYHSVKDIVGLLKNS
ncbi:PREDICTED: uncharacterized protein LOC100639981 [Amphimedon queenslandica]|nr:PREDICTED: uncharacterized protein LOC100639981 [Amphimedon queenslandica]|eukprot:XP_019850041.1 PREDICTED: uncharacterized protein LOC100639981 [Amphimedon queenslandica]